MKQALEAYNQDMLESGKYSSLNAVQLWDDLHSTLTSLTNQFIPSKLSSTRNNLLESTKNSNGLLDKHRNSSRPAERKMFLDLKHLFRKSIKLSYQSNLENILDVVSNDLTSKLNTKKIFTLLNIPNKILPLLHLYANTIMSIRTNPRKPLFLINSSSLFSRKFPFVTLNDKNVLMQTDPC